MVQKPNIVRGIPTLLVRAMPTIFYYGRYAGSKISDQAKLRFESHANYLAQGIELMASAMNDQALAAVADQAEELRLTQPDQIEQQLFQILIAFVYFF